MSKPISEAEGIMRQIARVDLVAMADQAASVATLDGIAYLRSRLQKTGRQPSGEPFSGYSIRPVPIYLYKGKSRLGGDAAFNRLKKAFPGGLASYLDWRVVNNLQVAYKDFTFTGRLLSSVKILDSVTTPGHVTKTFGPPDQEGQAKLANMYPKHGNILLFSSREVEEIGQTFQLELIDRLERI